MNLKYYYEKELNALHEEAHRFAKLYPEHASALNLEKNKAQDPHVERLLEGCAFLTAKIHEMVDKEAEHLPHQIIQRLWPQLSEPFPSACIISATPQPGMPPCVELPKGTELSSSPVGDESTILKFVTTDSVFIYPLNLTRVIHRQDEVEKVTLEFELEGNYEINDLSLKSLALYLDTNTSKAHRLIQLLTSSSTKLSLITEAGSFNRSSLRFYQPALDPEACMNDQSKSGLHAQQLLFEAIIFPEKLQYLVLRGFESIQFAPGLKRFSVHIEAPRLDHVYEFTRDDFRLFSLPAINVFQDDLEPIVLDHKRHSYPLSADHHRPESMQVLTVLSAKGTSDLNLPAVHYQPLSQMIDPKQPYFVFQWPPALSFNSPHLLKQTVSVQGLLCNGSYPRRYLRPHLLNLSDKKLQAQIKVSNLHQASAFFPQEPLGKRTQVLQLLRVQVEQLNKVEHLTLLLTLINRTKSEALIKKINALRQLSVNTRALISKGVFYQVHRLALEFEEDGFVSVSERYVFGRLLHAYFQSSASITTMIETELKFLPSEQTLTWLGPDA